MVDGHRLLCQWPFRVCFVVWFSCRRKEFGRNQGVVLKAGSVRGYRVWSQQISHQNRHRFSAILFCLSIHAPLRASLAMLIMWPCTLKLDEEKSKHVDFALQNGFGQHFCTEADISHNKVVVLLEKVLIDMIWLVLPISDWPIIMIGPGTLLLVVSQF